VISGKRATRRISDEGAMSIKSRVEAVAGSSGRSTRTINAASRLLGCRAALAAPLDFGKARR
jgi:hypothetical protein